MSRSHAHLALSAAGWAAFIAVMVWTMLFLAGEIVPRTVDDPSRTTTAGAIAVDAALLLLFAAQHSVMARRQVKSWLRRWIHADLERTTYVLCTNLSLGLLLLLWQPWGGQIWHVGGPVAIVLWSLCAAGWLLAIVSTFVVDHLELMGLRQTGWARPRVADAATGPHVGGLHAVVRHPLMTGLLLAFWATPRMGASHLFFALAVTGYVAVGIAFEQRDLRRTFGVAYDAYAARVPARVPDLRVRRRTSVGMALVIAAVGLATFGLAGPANATVTTSTITTPVNGTRYLITDASPATTVTVSGTSNGTTGDTVDVRCYERADSSTAVAYSVPLQANGSFTTTLNTSSPYGTCVLRAVPAGWPPGADTSSFSGPLVTTEQQTSVKIASGPNAGKTYDYYVSHQGSHAFNDYGSATDAGLYDSRLNFADGYSSAYFWEGSASLGANKGGARSFLRVDGRNAFGPYSAATLFTGSKDNPGLPSVTFSTSRTATGVTTIRETDPIVVCPEETFPPTSVSCPHFNTAGVRLERTIVTDDGGRQVHIKDVWRSTDGLPHTVSAHYDQGVEDHDLPTGAVDIGLKLPWLGSGYETFSAEVIQPGTTTVPGSIFVRDEATPGGGTAHPRGAITFDTAPSTVHRRDEGNFTLREEAIAVPAGGTRIVRHDYVIGTSEAEIAAKAAASRIRLNPRRPDGLVRAGSAAYVGNGIYNATGTGQTVRVKKKRTRMATFYVKVQNDGTLVDSYRLKGVGATKGFAVTYFSGTKDVTKAITSGTFSLTSVAPGQERVLRLVVKVKATARRGLIRSWLVSATSAQDPTRKDVVRASVKVARG